MVFVALIQEAIYWLESGDPNIEVKDRERDGAVS